MQIWNDNNQNNAGVKNNLMAAFKRGMKVKQIPKSEQGQEYQNFLNDFGLKRNDDFGR